MIDLTWAYEVDGLGGSLRMDDANAPRSSRYPRSWGVPDLTDPLLSRHPPMGSFDRQSLVVLRYGRRRHRVATHRASAYLADRLGDARPDGRKTASERFTCVRMLGATHAGTYLAHELFVADDPASFTRPWFAWANSLVGQLL